MPAVLTITPGTWTPLRNGLSGMSRTSGDNVPGFANVRAGQNTGGEFGVIPDEIIQFLSLMANELGIHFWQAHALTMGHLASLRSFGAPSRIDEATTTVPIGSISTPDPVP